VFSVVDWGQQLLNCVVYGKIRNNRHKVPAVLLITQQGLRLQWQFIEEDVRLID
jgi:hypothetical protein